MNANHIIEAGRALVLIAAGALLVGCVQHRESTPGAEGAQGVFTDATGHDIATVEYIVDPPDEITIQSPNIKELDKAKQVVRPDGKITLNLLGEVQVSGKTPAQINTLLKQMASKYYVNPDIKVEVVANSKFYNVVGQVNQGGRKPFTGNDSVVKALAEAGFNEQSWPPQVLLSRPSKHVTVVLNFDKIFQYGDLRQNYLLQEGDIIYVPYGPLAKFNIDLDRVIGPITGAGGVVGSGTNITHPGS